MKPYSPLLPVLIILGIHSLSQAEKSDTIPETIDPDHHYLFYLHGQIVEGSDGRPYHPEHGIYDYPKIVETLENKGFYVISEIRRANTSSNTYAGYVSFIIDQLKKEGVPSSHITVVGASKGGTIACYVSHKQQDPDINYVILAGFFNRLKDDPKMLVSGRVLSIHDSSDQNFINPKHFLKRSPAVTEQKIKMYRDGRGHGMVYQPEYNWVSEVVSWSRIHKKK